MPYEYDELDEMWNSMPKKPSFWEFMLALLEVSAVCVAFGVVIVLVDEATCAIENRRAQNKEIRNYKNSLPNYNDSIKNATDTVQYQDYVKKRVQIEQRLKQFKDSVRSKSK